MSLLSLVAVPIGNLKDITLRALEVLQEAEAIVCEDTRISLKLLQHYGISKPLLSYHEYNAEEMRPRLLSRLKEGEKLAYITDAGMPLISDPGFKLVLACRKEGISYTIIPGPSAVLSALCLSGLSPARFLFCGFCPPKSAARKRVLEEILPLRATLIFFESAKRLVPFLQDALDVFGDREGAVCREITKLYETVQKGALSSLIQQYTRVPARGEIVVLIEGHSGEQHEDIDLERHLLTSLQLYPLKEAVDIVSKAFNLPRREVYQCALQLNTKKTSL